MAKKENDHNATCTVRGMKLFYVCFAALITTKIFNTDF